MPCAHIGLFEKDPAEVVAVWKHFVLVGQIGAARVHQINAGQMVLRRNLLRAQMLFNRHRVISAAFDRCVIAHHHTVHATDPPDPGNQARAGCIVVVHVECGQLPDLKKRRARIKQGIHTFARQ